MDLLAFHKDDNIAAISTGGNTSAIAVIRCSGSSVFEAVNKIFTPQNTQKSLFEMKGYSQIYGHIFDKANLIDDVIVSVYKSPHSFTGENAIEISCHGSTYIQQKILQLLMAVGVRPAQPGEFTMRAFARGKFDLAQAEAIADLIDSRSEASHEVAIKHLKGNYSLKIKSLREEFINFASLLELELDFAEEEVEFADRSQFHKLITSIEEEISSLIDSYKIGKVLRSGIPVAIIGKPNVGKSTLLNILLEEDKAIISAIPGTTRDVIEDTIIIQGFLFRFIDTAGIRQSEDEIENLGIDRAFQKIEEASIILYLTDNKGFNTEELERISQLRNKGKSIIKIRNKIDLLQGQETEEQDVISISAKNLSNINSVIAGIMKEVEKYNIKDHTIVTNARHMNALLQTKNDLSSIKEGFMNDVPTDLIAIDVHNALHHLSEITGEITTEDLLGNIFGKFCIGK